MLAETATMAGTAASRAAGQVAARTVTEPVVAYRLGSPEDVAACCDALEAAVLEYFWERPTPERLLTVRKASARLQRRCVKDERTRDAAAELVARVIDFRDPAYVPANEPPEDIQIQHMDFEALLHHNTLQRSSGTILADEERFNAWMEEYQQVVRRGRLVRTREKADRVLRTLAGRIRRTLTIPTTDRSKA
ncbi:hypothetical protein OG618_36975 (plasmid) [Kitasatospora sp. NBC_01246]|uniref:hypothetical protein n=1 Tax=Kitasatospora sp. NBC_01246 TaxID=2903570 RepID=UPI002E354D86|nr:hypothetical protein [Kitasatospora sp. NBC_01246]